MTPVPYYSDEFVTLYHGDCREITEWLAADVLVTDPPYGIGWKQPNLPALAGSRRGRFGAMHAHEGIANDTDTSARDVALTLWGNQPAIVFASWSALVPGAKQTLVWKKPPTIGVIGARFGYRRDTEAVQLLGSHQQRPVCRSSVLVTSGSNTDYQDGSHPHMKPIGLLCSLIEWTTGVVADPFTGSGSTLVAAKRLGRKAIGVELDERYCEIAARRLSQGVLDFGSAS